MYIVRAIKIEEEINSEDLNYNKSRGSVSDSQTFYVESLEKLDEIRSRGFEIDAVKQNQIFTIPQPHRPNAKSIRMTREAAETGEAEVERKANWGAEHFRVQEFWKLNARGQSVKVGIADSGIFRDHHCFSSLNLKEFIDINTQTGEIVQTLPYDGNWHGTHCAGILCGVESDGMSRGVSPDIELYFAKVVDGISGSIISLNKALEWFHEKQCDIVSLSFGWPGLHDDWADAMFKLIQGGAIVFAASGNEFMSQPPDTPSPANYPFDGLFSIGAYDKQQNIWESSGGGTIDWPDDTYFSGKKNIVVPSLTGPGVEIISCVPGKGKYDSASATSMATPHIAGIAANILSYIRMKGLANEKMLTKQIINNAIVDAGQPGDDERYGKGILSVDKIMAQLQSL